MKSVEPGSNHFVVLPCLLNEQRRVRFCVPEQYTTTSRRGPYGRSVNISVIGGQPTITLTGPDIPTDGSLAGASEQRCASPVHSPHARPVEEPSTDTATESDAGKGVPLRQETELSLPDPQSTVQRLSTTDESISLLLHSQGRAATQGVEGSTPAPSTVVTLAAASIPETAHEGANTLEFENLLTPQPAQLDPGTSEPRPAGASDVSPIGHGDSTAAGSSDTSGQPGTSTAATVQGSSLGLPWGRGGLRRPFSPLPVAVFAGSGPEDPLSTASNGASTVAHSVATPGAAPIVASSLGSATAGPSLLSEESAGVAANDSAPLLQGLHAAGPSETTDGSRRASAAGSSAEPGKARAAVDLQVSTHAAEHVALGATDSHQQATPWRSSPDGGKSAVNDELYGEPPACFPRGCNGTMFARGMRVRRQYEMAVEVISASAQSCFRHTKIVHVRDKYIIENQTGEILEVRRTPLAAHPPDRLNPSVLRTGCL